MAIFTIPLNTPRPTNGLRRELDRLIEDSFPTRSAMRWAPAFDVRESGDRFQLEVDLPGVDAQSLEVLAEDGVLTVKGEKRTRAAAEGERTLVAERIAGAFLRRFQLPKNADTEKVSAQYIDGVLSIRIEKVVPAQPRRVEIRTGQQISPQQGEITNVS